MSEAVAVIIPNFNKEKVLRACLDSVYAQTSPPAEVIVVDDASTDGSPAIARAAGCALLELPVNRGPAAARNAGAAATTAPLLFFLDSDNALAPDALDNAVQALRTHPDVGVVQGVYDPVPLVDDGAVERFRVAYEHFRRRQATATLLSCTLIRREVYERAGGLDEGLRDGEDTDFGGRLPAECRRLVTATVVSRPDELDRLPALLRTEFSRAMTTPVTVLRAWRRRRGGAADTWRQMMSPARQSYADQVARLASGLAVLGLLGSPLALAVPWLLLVPPVSLAVVLLASHEFLRFAYRLRGARFALFAAGMHLLGHLTFVVGALAGLVRLAAGPVRRRGRRPAGDGPAGGSGGAG